MSGFSSQSECGFDTATVLAVVPQQTEWTASRGGRTTAGESLNLELRRLAADAELGRRGEDASIIGIDSVEPMLVCTDKVNRISTAKRYLR